jgi:glycosyltransferase involved in cell wall biosynthesis
LGVPIMATDVGGMRDVLAGGGGLLVRADITVEELCGELTSIINDSDKYRLLRKSATSRTDWASWSRSAKEVDTALSSVSL